MVRQTVKLMKPAILTLDDAFEHPYLMLSIVAICIGFIIFIMYNYYSANEYNTIKSNSTYFGKNPITDTPVFSVETVDSISCQTRCIEDPRCDGMTYDSSNSLCVGAKNGVLRSDASNYSAWVKPPTTIDPYLSKTIITSYADSTYTVKNQKIPAPSIVGQFAFAFWININDWYHNFQYWKHIAHKGTPLDGAINFQQWSDLTTAIPEQCIGLWLAPYTNNIRIAVSTEVITATGGNPVYGDANINLCNSTTGACALTDQLFNVNTNDNTVANRAVISNVVEFVDLMNIPINSLYHVAVVFNGNIMEIYTNGGLNKAVALKGQPIFNNGDMTVKAEKSFSGVIYQMCYVPLLTSVANIGEFYASKPKLSA